MVRQNAVRVYFGGSGGQNAAVKLVWKLELGPVRGARVGRFRRAFNTTVVCYRLGDVLIDCGPPNQFGAVREFASHAPLSRVVLTHHHEDHCGNAARLARELEVPVLAPAASLEPLAGGFPVQLYRRLVWGVPKRVSARPLPEEISVEGGFRLQPIAAPGHSADMTCLLEPRQGWLFAGDLYVTGRPRYLRSDEDVGQTIASLRRLESLSFDTLLCAHRGSLKKGPERLRKKREYLEELRGAARRRHRAGDTLEVITRALLGREDFLSWFSGFHFSKRNLVRSCLEGVNSETDSNHPGGNPERGARLG